MNPIVTALAIVHFHDEIESRVNQVRQQIEDAVAALSSLEFTEPELQRIDEILAGAD